jgi:plasmid stabilization system protein ParE
MVTVEWSVRARGRVQDIYDYLFDKAGERIARKITGKIIARTGILSTNPLAGHIEPNVSVENDEYRYLVEGNYKIIYWLEDEVITISTIFDCRQDPEKMKAEVAGRK